MKCRACGSPLEVSGVFPGGSVRCACGVGNVVPIAPAQKTSTDPYRQADRPHDEPKHEPAPIPAPEPRSHCSRCSRPLEPVTRNGYPVELCSAGHGLFVETAVLACMIDEAKSASPPDPDTAAQPALAGGGPVRYVPCPVCAQTMSRRNFGRISGILVDECPNHGTWFDAGELEQSMTFASSGRMQQQPPPAAIPETDRFLMDARHAESEELRRDRKMVDDAASIVDDVFFLLGLPSSRRRWGKW